ncbi:MAG: hypothetical protein U9R50_10890 [Campylobacterota bacterium]|nr:hypothetical protein [Campylobacterota bacterium]
MITKFLITTSFSLLSLLHADYISIYQMDEETQKIMYHDSSHSKIINSSKGDKSAMYFIDDKIYSVQYENGKAKVIDLDQMRSMMGSMGAQEQVNQKQDEFDFKIKKTGKKETVAGIKGEIWIIEGSDDGETFKDQIVVTKDKRVVKAMHAMTRMFSKMSGGATDDSGNIFELEKGYATIKSDGMVLRSFKEKQLPKSDYELPKDAQMQEMPNIAALFGGGGAPSNDGKKTKGLLDPCYNEVCCGKTAGASNVLAPMLKPRSGGYELVGEGVCDALGISSLFGVKSVEGALYKKGDDPIQVTLNLDDTSGGAVATTKKQLDSGTSLIVKSIQNYKKGVMGTASYEYGMMMPMKQQTLDIVIDSKTVLSITRIATSGEIDLISWTKRAIDLDAFKKDVVKKDTSTTKKSQDSKTEDDTAVDTENINKTVDDAVNMFKSLF